MVPSLDLQFLINLRDKNAGPRQFHQLINYQSPNSVLEMSRSKLAITSWTSLLQYCNENERSSFCVFHDRVTQGWSRSRGRRPPPGEYSHPWSDSLSTQRTAGAPIPCDMQLPKSELLVDSCIPWSPAIYKRTHQIQHEEEKKVCQNMSKLRGFVVGNLVTPHISALRGANFKIACKRHHQHLAACPT